MNRVDLYAMQPGDAFDLHTEEGSRYRVTSVGIPRALGGNLFTGFQMDREGAPVIDSEDAELQTGIIREREVVVMAHPDGDIEVDRHVEFYSREHLPFATSKIVIIEPVEK